MDYRQENYMKYVFRDTIYFMRITKEFNQNILLNFQQ